MVFMVRLASGYVEACPPCLSCPWAACCRLPFLAFLLLLLLLLLLLILLQFLLFLLVFLLELLELLLLLWSTAALLSSAFLC